VIYFPSAKEPGKVVPFPFFSFDEDRLKKVALQRLLGGIDEKSYAGEIVQLFPKDARLLSLTEQNGAVTCNFSKELRPVAANPGNAGALFNAITLTVMQFGGVSAVRIQCDGSDLFPPDMRPPDLATAVLQPSAPRLLNVIALKKSQVSPMEELDALFDRPVDIKEFQFSTVDGSALSGDVFHSMFDMAAVLKPSDPGKLTGLTQVKVRWKVVDKTGRSAAGEGTVTLDVKMHQD